MRDVIRADENFPAGRHRRPDLSHLPRCPVREALLDNWHRRAQSIVWTCANIVHRIQVVRELAKNDSTTKLSTL
ncbi:hypothetical protein MJO28_008996 [Puccinia striiformis f. sp. tritici]|uniref:Uncharacterized protein n=3 Tax=Puccinia striiformis TaxID=27350 RepID=A0A0L0UQJ9_9BASI|nr:hypothetical protein Pst134EB_016111 [Puccinia striiformis f. sp. tritici]KAI7950175.1 hypothetical protein MJO28_008996 [Puccinia striiformis f. sp. tritici]KAI9606272.1 hypothetical protein KEM48_001981 [Puccinia striiformis f. sp. tritici PST-130]KNE89196.1 hypothetical protein PSTG_17347 [Puccinia striiformis f. sp. tritici PST-78]POV95798.1 hypothetical protein PSTT_16054 [Puccinia striiformis]